MKVGFLTADTDDECTPGGCAWYRGILPLSECRKHMGWDFAWSNGANIAETGEISFGEYRPDILIVQRWMDDNAPELLEGAKRAGQLIVNDIDDLFTSLPQTNKAHALTDPKKNAKRNRDHYIRALGVSDLVIASTPYLAKELKRTLRKSHVRIEVIRNAVDPRFLTRRYPTFAKPVIGWTGSVDHRARDLEVIADALSQLHVPLCHVGWDGRVGNAFGGAGVTVTQCTNVPRLPIERWPEAADHFSIGIAPLRDLPFNRAKSAIKIMEYSAAGRPWVASPLPEYRWFAQDIEQRLFGESQRSWLVCLRRLMTDHAFYQDFAESARARAERESISHRWTDWADVLGNLAKSTP